MVVVGVGAVAAAEAVDNKLRGLGLLISIMIMIADLRHLSEKVRRWHVTLARNPDHLHQHSKIRWLRKGTPKKIWSHRNLISRLKPVKQGARRWHRPQPLQVRQSRTPHRKLALRPQM